MAIAQRRRPRHGDLQGGELKQRMEVDRATVYKSAAGTAEIKTTNTYDPSTLDAVLELLPQQEYVDAGALVPEHEEKTKTVKRKWNVTKLRPVQEAQRRH